MIPGGHGVQTVFGFGHSGLAPQWTVDLTNVLLAAFTVALRHGDGEHDHCRAVTNTCRVSHGFCLTCCVGRSDTSSTIRSTREKVWRHTKMDACLLCESQ